jgi:cation-transporting ATPase 13A1
MLSIYKILGINCLVNAMVLSKLFLNGVKQGDRQMTILGVVVTALFYFITRADPLPTLSSVRPPSSIMSVRALLSIGLQCAIHCLCIAVATDVALSFVDPFDPSLVPDGAFNANPLNSTSFLFTCLATINAFAVNYRGRPFMADLVENKLFYHSLQVCYATMFVLVTECFIPLNDLLQLGPLPTLADGNSNVQAAGIVFEMIHNLGFSGFLGSLMVLDTVLVFGVERMLR